MSLEDIRKFFPDWPSEFDVAKIPSHWAALAQEYYCAATVLNDEIIKCNKYLFDEKPKYPSDSIIIRLKLGRPAIFCFTFAIELIVKAVYIKKIARLKMKPNEKIFLKSHNVIELLQEMPEIELNDNEKQLLDSIEALIKDGKYSSGLKPSNSKEPLSLPNFINFKNIAEPLYQRLQKMIQA